MIKKIIALSLVAFLLSASCCVFALDDNFENEKQSDENKRIVKVGYIDYDGFIEKRDDGTMYGYGCEYLENIKQHTNNWEYAYSYDTWENNCEKLKLGEIDLLCTAQRTPQREEDYLFSEHEVGMEYGMMYVLPENKDIYYEDFSNFEGITVGMLSGSFQNEVFESYSKTNRFSTNVIYYDTTAEVQAALADKKVDAICLGSLNGTTDLRIVARFAPEPFYCITGKQNASLMQELDNAAEYIYDKQPYLNGMLYEKYYNKPNGIAQEITRDEADYIASNKTLRVVSKTREKFQYLNTNSKESDEIYIEFLTIVEKISGIGFDYVPSTSNDDGLAMLAHNKADLIPRVYVNSTVAKQNGINCSVPYMNTRMLALGLNNIEFKEKKELKIAIVDSFVGAEFYLKENFPGCKVTSYDDFNECITAIQQNKADIFVESSHFLQGYFNLTHYENIGIIAPYEERLPLLPLGVGISKTISPTAISILNKAIEAIPTDQINDVIIQSTIQSEYKPTAYETLINNLPVVIIVVALCAIFIIALLRQKERKYKEMALIDDLTGLWNKNRFKYEAEIILNRTKSISYAIVSMDIEKFKFYNESFGFSAGNDLLQEIAKAMLETIQNAAIFSRWVADDFVIMIEYKGDDALLLTLEKIKSNMNKIELANKDHFRFVVKTGIYISSFSGENRSITEMVDKANLAKQTVKGKHNLNTAFYDKELDSHITNENEIELKMVESLQNNEFVVYYQPKIDLLTEEVIGAEALVRWDDPERGLIPPNSFIPLFERNGYIVKLDFYVYERVCHDIREWQKTGKKIVPISINISRTHFNTQSFVRDLFNLVDRYEVSPELIELELTESVLESLNDGIMMTMMILKEKGFNISIDDFGSGYSSLNLLKDVPFDILKLDKAFLDQCDDSKKSSIIIQKVVEMARDIGVFTICEGVETRDQADFLKSIGCNMAQGFLFAKPLPLNDFEKLINDNL